MGAILCPPPRPFLLQLMKFHNTCHTSLYLTLPLECLPSMTPHHNCVMGITALLLWMRPAQISSVKPLFLSTSWLPAPLPLPLTPYSPTSHPIPIVGASFTLLPLVAGISTHSELGAVACMFTSPTGHHSRTLMVTPGSLMGPPFQ